MSLGEPGREKDEVDSGRCIMRIVRGVVARAEMPASVAMLTAERRDVRRREASAEVTGVARCPRCGGELIARVARGRPGFWCRCPVRRVVAVGA